MDNLDILQKIYIDNLIQQSKHNISILEELLYKAYPFDEITDLIKKLCESMNRILLKLTDIKTELMSNGSSMEIDNRIKLYGSLLAKIHKLYKYLEVSRVENVPNSKVYLLEYLVKKIYPESSFILIPSYESNFLCLELSEWLHNKFRLAIDDVDELFPLSEKKFTIILYPFAYKNTLFSNVLLSHEIGHFIENKHKISNIITSHLQLDRDRINRIALNEITRIFSGFQRPMDLFSSWEEVIVSYNNAITKIVNNWLKEISCDYIAFKMIGPSYITSFIEFILTRVAVTESTRKHPPPAFRLNIIFSKYFSDEYSKKLKNSNYSPLIDFDNYLYKIKSNMEETVFSEESIGEVYYYAYEIVKEKLNDLLKETQKIIDQLDITYNIDVLINEIKPLFYSINELIVPCEIKQGIPAKPITVINAGIIYRVIMIDKLFTKFGEGLNVDSVDFNYNLNQILMKGLELCLIQNKITPLLD